MHRHQTPKPTPKIKTPGPKLGGLESGADANAHARTDAGARVAMNKMSSVVDRL
jgi:hypothetical protein